MLEVPVNYDEIVKERIDTLELDYKQTIDKTEVIDENEKVEDKSKSKHEKNIEIEANTDYAQIGDYQNLGDDDDDFYEVEEVTNFQVESFPQIQAEEVKPTSLTKDQSDKIKKSMQSIKIPTPKWAEQ